MAAFGLPFLSYAPNRLLSGKSLSLFSLLHGQPDMLPPAWAKRAGEAGSPAAARTVCDWLAGMTDKFALEEHRRLTDPNIPG